MREGHLRVSVPTTERSDAIMPFLFVNEDEPLLMKKDIPEHFAQCQEQRAPQATGLEPLLGSPYCLGGFTVPTFRRTPQEVNLLVSKGTMTLGTYQSVLVAVNGEWSTAAIESMLGPLLQYQRFPGVGHFHELQFETDKPDTTGTCVKDLTEHLYSIVKESGVEEGTLVLQDKHTTTALHTCVWSEVALIAAYLHAAVPKGAYAHDDIKLRQQTDPKCPEGEPPNARSHMKSMRLPNDLLIPVVGNELLLNALRVVYFDFDGPVNPSRPHKSPCRTVQSCILPMQRDYHG